MVTIDQEKSSRYFITGLLVFSVILSLFVVWPYLTPILTSIIIAYVFYPVYEKIQSKVNHKETTALIVTILIILLLVVPTFFMLFQMSKEMQFIYITVKQQLASGEIIPACADSTIACSAVNSVKGLIEDETVKYYLYDNLAKLTKTMGSKIGEFIFSIPKRAIDLFITFFLTYFLFLDGKALVRKIEDSLPLKPKERVVIFQKMHEVTHAIIYGFIVMALAQGILAMLIFSIAGVHSPIFWGFCIGFLALIPFIGGSIIYLPIAVMQFFAGETLSAGIVIAGGIVISVLDTFIKPKIIGDKSAVHPILMFLGLIGGIQLLGLIGFIVGPLILSLFVTFFKMYRKVHGSIFR